MKLDYKSIGKRIKIARIKRDMTQERLAMEIDISPTHLSNIETGSTKLSLATLVKLANALEITADDLLCDSVIKADFQLRRDIQEAVADCDEYEIRVIKDVIKALKNSLRKDSDLKSRE